VGGKIQKTGGGKKGEKREKKRKKTKTYYQNRQNLTCAGIIKR
jgi:hypothetical protein